MYFGVIVSGRPVIAEATQIVPPNKVVFSIPASPPFSHIVVFLLPGQSLPEGHAAAVYVEIPPQSEFTLLGAIADEKPSAIFKLSNVGGNGDANAMTDAPAPPGANLVLGFSIEPRADVSAALARNNIKASFSAALAGPGAGMALVQSPPQQPTTAKQASTKELAKRIIQNAYNFLSSFSGNVVNGVEVVPLKAFNDWWTKFERRIEQDPAFLERPQT